MHPLLQEFLVATLRHWLTMLGMWLVTKGWIANDTPAVEKYAAGLAVLFVAFMWSYWGKVRSRITFLAALEAEPGTPEREVVARAKAIPPGLVR